MTLTISVSRPLRKRYSDVFRAVDVLRRLGPDAVSPVISRVLDAGGRLVPLESQETEGSSFRPCVAAYGEALQRPHRLTTGEGRF